MEERERQVLTPKKNDFMAISKPGDAAAAAPSTKVVEVVTFKLRGGVTAAQFRLVDQEVETQHVSKQPGFVSRESAAGEHGEWLVIVHWRSAADADASMASFETAPAAAKFMSSIDASTMRMKRYDGWR
jgi:hypothetical protein